MKHDPHTNVAELMQGIGRAARAAARVLALAPAEQKNRALRAAAAALRARGSEILAANDSDMRAAAAGRTSAALLDRLRLDADRVERHGPWTRGHRESRRSHRQGVGAMVPPERFGYPAGERAPGRDRHHLREPPQRHRRRRRAVPEIEQRRDFAGRLGKRRIQRGDP